MLHRGAVAEMMTGEGKTLAGVAPAYLNALSGEGVHVVTVNEYLSRRDAVWMGKIYRLLGLTVGSIIPRCGVPLRSRMGDSRSRTRRPKRKKWRPREAFWCNRNFCVRSRAAKRIAADITYGTNHEFGFDYLRDNLIYRAGRSRPAGA